MIQLKVEVATAFVMSPAEWDSVGGAKAAIERVVRSAVQNYCTEHDVDYVAVRVMLKDD